MTPRPQSTTDWNVVPNYPRVSSFRSPELEVLLYSPHVRMESNTWTLSRSIPVYGDHDVVGGKVLAAPTSTPGRIVITLLGTCLHDSGPHNAGRLGRRKHRFFSESKVIYVTESDSARKGMRQVFSRQSRASSTMGDAEARSFPFAFELARNQRPGEILPTTISPSESKALAVEVSYQVTVTWEPLKLTQEPSLLAVPIIVQSDPEFHSLDGVQSSWIEIPLRAHRPVPVHCAVTLPSTLTFARGSSLPFFVVFTTTPRSSSLAKEISGDATISLNLLCHVSVLEDNVCSPTETESLMSDRSSDSRSSRLPRFLKRSRKTSFSSLQSSDSNNTSTSLPLLTSRVAFSETQTVVHKMSLGFPKRPRHVSSNTKAHPTLEELRTLPDGLYKDKIPLGNDILTSFNWGGTFVKYYLEVSVLIGQDELRAKILLRIT
ncbi:hypothetical protein R3P38DRAFT_492807 [Favolaschia claudopus]|uniref:Arrestin-like N-terminal domain-containing protein n=1 Tax=Favolaschia claudopus TaxID=2862362 RepID=A0AAW0CMZ7_9AGAR